MIADAVKVVEDSIEGAARPEMHSEVFVSAPVPTLVDLSKEAQLVVVGCRGQTALRRGLLGSVGTGLVHHAHCPVAVIHDEVPFLLEHSRLPVLVGIDGSPAAELATAIAFDEACWRGADLVALHAWSEWGRRSDKSKQLESKGFSPRLRGLMSDLWRWVCPRRHGS